MGLIHRIHRLASVAMVLVLVACGGDSGSDDATVSPTPSAERDRSQESSSESINGVTTQSPMPTQQSVGEFASPTADAANLDADGDGWLTADEFQIALIQANGNYEYAPGYLMDGEQAWISFTAGNPDQAVGAEYQIGLADMMLGVYYECSWMLSWIDAFATGDTELQDKALTQLERLTEPGYFDDQASRDAVASVLGQAQLGDPAGIQQWVNNNCQNIKWAN